MSECKSITACSCGEENDYYLFCLVRSPTTFIKLHRCPSGHLVIVKHTNHFLFTYLNIFQRHLTVRWSSFLVLLANSSHSLLLLLHRWIAIIYFKEPKGFQSSPSVFACVWSEHHVQYNTVPLWLIYIHLCSLPLSYSVPVGSTTFVAPEMCTMSHSWNVAHYVI